MRKTPHKIVAAILLLIILASFRINIGSRNANAETTILDDGRIELDVSVRGTFLHAEQYRDINGDSLLDPPGGGPVEPPEIVDLQACGFKPGDKMFIVFSTAWDDWQLWDLSRMRYQQLNTVSGALIGIFSASSDLAPIEQLHRVPGAIDAGADIVTVLTAFNKEPTDIPEDFTIFPGTDFSIEVPPNAKYLFLCLNDPYYPDCMGSCTVKLDKDSDGDGLWDSWEIKGIDVGNDGIIDLKLVGANPKHKDIFVEVDCMEGHRLSAVARDNVVAAFRSAPVKNPDNNNGINIHIEIDDTGYIPHLSSLHVDANTGYWPEFDRIKKDHFGTLDQQKDANVLKAKKMAYHYCLMAHTYANYNKTSGKWVETTSGGIAEPYGNDFIVTLGSWTGGVGSNEEQAGTFMHELGHNLGLRHGGGDDVNYKPNYLSIMNYLFQVPYAPLVRALQAPLSYSSYAQPDLYEKSLNETKGIGAAPWPWTAYSAQLKTTSGIKMVPLPVPTSMGIDWNNNGEDNETKVWANINYYPKGPFTYNSPNNESLKGFDDWQNLRFNFKETKDYEDGVHSTEFGVDELTWEIVQAMREAAEQVYNVAALNLSVPPGSVGQTGLIVKLTLANFGGKEGTYNVTVYANTTSIASKTLTLSRGNTTTLSLLCTTTGLRMGNYTLTAYVNPVVNETYTADNTIHGSVIKVVDGTPPTVTISSPTSGSEVKSSTVTVTWVGSDANSGIAGYEIQLDGGSWTNMGTGMSRELTGLSDGSHTIEVRATDMGGNTKVATVNFSVSTSSWLLPVVAVGVLVAVVVVVVFLRRRGGRK